ncbi:MAG: Na(+)/H(+) antiporter subunit D [Candidatus Omnitrophota bacterium]|nr:Na(+)/H(+) antiporter subunit D [Candidatus Omnitrophota bacterium]
MHPSIPFFLAPIVLAIAGPRLRRVLQIAVPLAAFFLLRATAPLGAGRSEIILSFMGYGFIPIRMDALALLFAYTFIIFGLLANIYGLHATDRRTPVASNIYIGSSIGAVLAGDLVTLFIFWEIMALSSALLIWNKDRAASVGAMFRYLLVHLTGGLFFFSGILIKLIAKEAMTFEALGWSTASQLIFIGFAVNAAIPPLHAWLSDAYPEGTPTGSLYLSCFTTKVAVYAFARGFAGSEILIWLGAFAAVYGVIFALMENDTRRLLAYHIICQVGYMLCGIGIGSAIGVNAGTGHAIGNILFKGLLFMATGAIIEATGKSKLSELGGLASRMPLVFSFYMVGTLAISGAPLLNGYITKGLLLKSAAEAHMGWLELLLLLVAVGTFLSIGCKLAYFAFFGKPCDVKIKPVPANSHVAMAATSILCFSIGIFPNTFIPLLPFPQHGGFYDAAHVIHNLQLLLGTYLGFLFIRQYLHTEDTLTLDTDWFYRRASELFIKGICFPIHFTQLLVQQAWTLSIALLHTHISEKFLPQRMTPLSYPLLWMTTAFAIAGFTLLILKFS